MYERIGVINPTVSRPVLICEPMGLRDRQAIPPYGWCGRCGGEIYRKNAPLCGDCNETEERL